MLQKVMKAIAPNPGEALPDDLAAIAAVRNTSVSR